MKSEIISEVGSMWMVEAAKPSPQSSQNKQQDPTLPQQEVGSILNNSAAVMLNAGGSVISDWLPDLRILS